MITAIIQSRMGKYEGSMEESGRRVGCLILKSQDRTGTVE